VCGNQLKTFDETCEDGDKQDSKGCSADCLSVLPGWSCQFDGNIGIDVCKEICGDGKVVGAEKCDDFGLLGCLEGC